MIDTFKYMGATSSNKIIVKASGQDPPRWTRQNSMGWTRTKGLETKHEVTPEMNEAFDAFFPGALKGKTAEIHFASTLMKNGFDAENTLFCDSSCPDEINHDDPNDDITMLFQ